MNKLVPMIASAAIALTLCACGAQQQAQGVTIEGVTFSVPDGFALDESRTDHDSYGDTYLIVADNDGMIVDVSSEEFTPSGNFDSKEVDGVTVWWETWEDGGRVMFNNDGRFYEIHTFGGSEEEAQRRVSMIVDSLSFPS